ncbi:TPA: glycosyltransferase, partial [Streptococcus suis]
IRSIGSKLDFEIKEKESERLLQEQILLQKYELEKSLINLQFEYNKVISSRRWTIPTKIINFFRRK